MPRTAIHSDRAPAAIGPVFAGHPCRQPGVLQRADPLDPATGDLVAGDIAAQVGGAFDNLKAVCEAAGGTMDDIVRVGLYRPTSRNSLRSTR